MNLQVKLFGMPTVSRDGIRLSFPLKKTEGLFYYLLLNKNVSREQIASMFWQDRDENSAANNLRNSIYMLRKLFTHDIVLSDKRIVSLNPEVVCDLDLDHIDDIANPEFPDPQRYALEFLDGFEILDSDGFTAWLRGMRLKVEETFQDRMKDRIQRCYDGENKEELLRSLSLMVTCDVSDEAFVLELMELHASENRLPKALQIYREYEKRLKQDLGITPSERARNFYAKLSAHSLGAAGKEPRENIRDFFFAREAELLEISRFLQTADLSRGCCINIYGEPGVGKSTLARQLLGKAKQSHGLVLTAKAYDVGNKYFFSPWYDVVRGLNAKCDLSALDLDPIKVSLLSATFPGTFEKRLLTVNYEITSLFKEPSPVLLAHIFVEIFQKLRANGEIMLLLEDIQWFDEMSMHLLIAFLSELDIPVTVATTSRTKPGRNMRNMIENLSLRGETELLSLELLPFSLEEATDFLEMALEPSKFAFLDVDKVYTQTYGLPLFLAELVSSIRGGGDARTFQDKIHNVLAWRYGDIPSDQRELLELVSIFLSDAPFEVLVSTLGADRLSLSKKIGDLTSQGTLIETEDDQGNLRLRFHHDCLRDFFYENIPQVRRRELHRVLAERLESVYDIEVWDPSISSALCHHLHHAAMPVKELDFMLREMRMHVMLQHELFPPLTDDQLKRSAGLLSGKAETMSRLEDLKNLLFNLDRKKVSPHDYLRMEATVLELQGGYMVGWGQYSEGLKAIHRGLELAKSNDFRRIHLNCLKHICYYGVQTENFKVLEQQAQEMLFVAREYNDERVQAIALRFLGIAAQLKGEFEGAKEALTDSMTLFERLGKGGHPYTLGVLAARSYIGEMYHWRNDLPEALGLFDSCIESCDRAGLSWGLSLFYSKAGNVAFDMGLTDRAREYVSKSISLFETGQGGRSGSIAYSLRAVLDAQEGFYARALLSLQASENLCVPINKRSWMAVHYTAAACVKRRLEERRDVASLDEGYASLDAFLNEDGTFYEERALALARALNIVPKVNLLQRQA